MKLVLGIGNIGYQYEDTRHNTGFKVLDKFASKYNTSISKEEFKSMTTRIEINNETILLIKPTTLVNLSGQSLLSNMLFYKIKKEDILIVYDDMDIQPGKIKLSRSGNSAGHNGIKNIIEVLNSNEFDRIKVGIGRSKLNKINYVLGKPTGVELDNWNLGIDLAVDALIYIFNNSFERAMNKYNAK